MSRVGRKVQETSSSRNAVLIQWHGGALVHVRPILRLLYSAVSRANDTKIDAHDMASLVLEGNGLLDCSEETKKYKKTTRAEDHPARFERH
jgi:hypothetical protein